MLKFKLNEIKGGLSRYFNKRGLRAENVKGFINNYPDTDIYADDADNMNYVLAIEGTDFHYFDCIDLSCVNCLGGLISSREYIAFAGTDMDISNEIVNKYSKEIIWQNPCDFFYYPEKNIELITPNRGVVSPVDVKDAKTIDEYYTYRDEGSLAAIIEDIISRHSSAVYIDGKICSWTLMHADNSMGIMFTLPEMRGQGYAEVAARDLIKKVLDSGSVPFVHIVSTNYPSKRLAERCRMKFSHAVNWIGMRTQ